MHAYSRFVTSMVCVFTFLIVCCIGFARADKGVDMQKIKSTSWWAEVQKNLREQEYEITCQEPIGALHAVNRAANLRAFFRAGGVELMPRIDDAGWCWGYQLTSFGREGALMPVRNVAPSAEGRRVEYRQKGITEWYVNRDEGIEQGFVIYEQPEGAGALIIEGRVSGSLEARLDPQGHAVVFHQVGEEELSYGNLHVEDTDGEALSAHLALTGDRLRIVIDENGRYPIHVDPLLTTPSWMAESDQADAYFGWSVSSAGDVNGDSYDDVIVGAPDYDNGQTNEGRAYVYHGSASGLSTTPAWMAESDQANARLGRSVSSAGDVNGDTYDDVIVGAPFYDNGPLDEGWAYVYHGSATGLSTTPDWTAESDWDYAYFGCSVSGAGDVNGDTYDDVIVGAHLYGSYTTTGEGRAYVFHGSASGLSTTPEWVAESNYYMANFGISVSGAGDVNGDSYADVVVGAYKYGFEKEDGRAYVYHGSGAGLSTTPAWTARGIQAYAHFGWSVSDAGDVNGDSYDDVIVGAYDYSNGQTNEGRAFVYCGSDTGLSVTADWTAESDQASAHFGWSVSDAGDVNGDSYDDVIVGAYEYSNGQTNEGQAFVYCGSDTGLSTTADWMAESDQAYARFGCSVSDAGNVNGDSYDDVIVGAYYYDNGETNEGRAFVYYGSPPTGVNPYESSAFALYQNVPNPFNPTTVIHYYVPPSGGRVTLKIFDVGGRLLKTLHDGEQGAGHKAVLWDGKNSHGQRVATGVYFYRMQAPGFEKTLKMVLLQ